MLPTNPNPGDYVIGYYPELNCVAVGRVHSATKDESLVLEGGWHTNYKVLPLRKDQIAVCYTWPATWHTITSNQYEALTQIVVGNNCTQNDPERT